jgi:hypothetical protein
MLKLSKGKQPTFAIICFIFDVSQQFSYHMLGFYHLTQFIDYPGASNEGLYIWTNYSLSLILIWCTLNICIVSIPRDIAILKMSAHKHSYKKLFDRIKGTFLDLWNHQLSDEKQDIYESFLNLGYLSYLYFRDPVETLNEASESLKNLSADEK